MKFPRVFFAGIVLLFSVMSVNAQTVDEIVSKHVEAIGGKEAWKKVSSLKLEGVLNVQSTDVNILVTQLHGKGMRQDISVQGQTGYQIVTPTAGWRYMPFQGQTQIDSMSQEEVKLAQNELDTHGSLVEYKEKGHKAELAGKENIGEIESYKIILTLSSGKKETFFIDPKTYYVVRTITKQKVNGQDEDVEANYASYEKTTEGIVLPKAISFPYGNMTVSKIEVNTPVDEGIFKPSSK